MYADGTQTSGRFLQHVGSPSTSFFSSSCSVTPGPCPCCRYVQCEPPPPPYRREMGFPPAGDGDAGWRAPAAGAEPRSPQRRPVLAAALAAAPGRPQDWAQSCRWESHPAQWPGDTHYPPVREHCGCVACRARPLAVSVPHLLPHPRVKGQGYRHKRTVRYVAVEEEEEESCGCASEDYHSGRYDAHVGPLYAANGHCGPRGGLSAEEGGRDGYQEGGSEERCCDRAAAASHQGFFPTEVPQRQLLPSRLKELRVPPSSAAAVVPEAPWPPATNGERPGQGSEVVRQRGVAGGRRRRKRRDLVREQIRRVVTDLEDVLGGLKQVHVEMKEVVQEIDRLTASIDLGEEVPCLAQEEAAPVNFYASNHGDDLLPALPHSTTREDRIILRTNSPSPVHTASVVKTSRFTPANHSKDTNHAPGMNGHPPQLCPARDPDPRPQSLDPKVTVWNGTSNSRTEKPPRYPQNGRCGKGLHSPPQPAGTPTNPGRGRQNASMV